MASAVVAIDNGTVLDAVRESLEEATRPPSGVEAPVAIIWTDPDAQWKPLLSALKGAIPNLYSLGAYAPDDRTGPVIWLKCVIDRTIPDVSPPPGVVPVLYLPDVSRQDLRAGGDCPDVLKPLVEVLYRGAAWHQRNGSDWSVYAFLTSEFGLRLQIARDENTQQALTRSLRALASVPIASMKGKVLQGPDFDRLTVDDPVRDLLLWLSNPEKAKHDFGAQKWETFVSVCKATYRIDPNGDGLEKAGTGILHADPAWGPVWQRFREGPHLYGGLAKLLGNAPKRDFLYDRSRDPQINIKEEEALRNALEKVPELPHVKACDQIVELERVHGLRRAWVWERLGQSPLAVALKHFAALATKGHNPVGGASIDEMIQRYTGGAWEADRAALDALLAVSAPKDIALVKRVVRALYEPWLDVSARNFQKLVRQDPRKMRELSVPVGVEDDVCIVFADGLRFDVGGRLQEVLEARGFKVVMRHRVSPLPTITATAKPMASPASGRFKGTPTTETFQPVVAASGQPADAKRIREEMSRMGVEVIGPDELKIATGRHPGWTETGNLDSRGHDLGADLVNLIKLEIEAMADRVIGLLQGGWRKVRIATDHGWLILPGALPKVDMPSYLVGRKGVRAAAVKGDAAVDHPVYEWHWNPEVRVVSPEGIYAFYAEEYAHGGVTLQECVVPDMIVEGNGARSKGEIVSATWRGLRLTVKFKDLDGDLRVDVRTRSGDARSSILGALVAVQGAQASLLVENESLEGTSVTVVLIDGDGMVISRVQTLVGGE